jgi:hypothetical protein
VESVGVNIARSVVEPTTVGVHEQEARPAVVATAEHAVMVSLPLTKATFPGTVVTAEIETGFPYLAVVTDPGSESVRVGVALLTTNVTTTDGVAEAESRAEIVCVYVPTASKRGALRRINPAGV